mgnify:CR=1
MFSEEILYRINQGSFECFMITSMHIDSCVFIHDKEVIIFVEDGKWEGGTRSYFLWYELFLLKCFECIIMEKNMYRFSLL